jgi:hypothetical protein
MTGGMRVAEAAPVEPGAHRLEHTQIERRRCLMVEVDEARHGAKQALP